MFYLKNITNMFISLSVQKHKHFEQLYLTNNYMQQLYATKLKEPLTINFHSSAFSATCKRKSSLLKS